MKVKTDTILTDLEGNPLKNDKDILRLGPVLANLLAYTPSDNQYQSYFLAKKFSTNKEVDLKAEDVVFIKEIIKKSQLAPISAGQIIEKLEK